MDTLRWSSDLPTLRNPILIAAFEGWGDAGDAASTAARHVRDRLAGEGFASIDPEPYYDFTTVRPSVRLVPGGREIDWPENEFCAVPLPGGEHDLIVLSGVEPNFRWRSYCEQLMTLIDRLDVSMVVCLGALIADVVHTRPATVYSSGYDHALNQRLDLEPSSYEGPTGIVGVLHDALSQHNIPSMSLWATVPGYVPHATSPKAALALVERVGQLIGHKVPSTALEIGAAAYERQITEMVDDSDETKAYVAQLEETYDNTMSVESGAELISELEEFLRDN
ncbi:MAG: PAC2 family protein [Acidimicrobiales bacterium]